MQQVKDSPYTQQGLEELARIIRSSRGSKSQHDFEKLVDVSHATISRIEQGLVKEPSIATLIKIAPHTPYNVAELIAIALGLSETEAVRQFRTAEDVWAIVEMLPKSEAGRLIKMLVEKWMIDAPQD